MTGHLPLQLALTLPLVSATVIIHLTGLAGLGRLLRALERRLRAPSGRINRLAVLLPIAFGLVALHTVEIWVYAAVFHLVGATRDFEHALFHSLTAYATIGYDDAVLADRWRVMGGVEGINGVLMLGWSTAFLVAAIERTRQTDEPPLVDPSRLGRGE